MAKQPSLLEKIVAKRESREEGFDKPIPKRKSAVHMGAKHTAKTVATRAIKDSVGNNLIGSILSLLMRDTINKTMK